MAQSDLDRLLADLLSSDDEDEVNKEVNQEEEPSLEKTGENLEPVLSTTGTYLGPASDDNHKPPGASATENGDASQRATTAGPENRSEEPVDVLAQRSSPEESNRLLGVEAESESVREVPQIDDDMATSIQTQAPLPIPVVEAASFDDNEDAGLSPVRTQSEEFGVVTEPPTLTSTVDQPREAPVPSFPVNTEPGVQGEATRPAVAQNMSNGDYHSGETFGFSAALGDPSMFSPASDVDSETQNFDPMLMSMDLIEQLTSFEGSWPESGWIDNRGAVTGCHGVVRAFQFAPFDQVFRCAGQTGQPTAVAKHLGMVAIGTSAGTVALYVPGTQGNPALRVLSSPAVPRGDQVTALALGSHGGAPLLVCGHASGTIHLWELKARALSGPPAWSLARSIRGVHGARVTAITIADGAAGAASHGVAAALAAAPGAGPTTWALSADEHGRLVAHNLNRHLSATSQALTNFARQLTGVSTMPASHSLDLTVFSQQQRNEVETTRSDGGTESTSSTPRPSPRTRGQSSAVLDVRVLPSLDGEPRRGALPPAAHFVDPVGHWVLVRTVHNVILAVLTPDGHLRVQHVFDGKEQQPVALDASSVWIPTAMAWSLVRRGSNESSGGAIEEHLVARIAMAWSSFSEEEIMLSPGQQQKRLLDQDRGRLDGSSVVVTLYAVDVPSSSTTTTTMTSPRSKPGGVHRAASPVLQQETESASASLPSSSSGVSPKHIRSLKHSVRLCRGVYVSSRSGLVTAVSIAGNAGTRTRITSWSAEVWQDRNDSSTNETENLEVPDWLVGIAENDEDLSVSLEHRLTAPASIASAAAGEQLLLLGSQHLYVAQACTRDQRQEALAASGRPAAALLDALRARVLLKGQEESDHQPTGWPSHRPPENDRMALESIQKWLLDVVNQGLEASGMSSQDDNLSNNPSTVFPSVPVLARIAVNTSALLEKEQQQQTSSSLLCGRVASAFFNPPPTVPNPEFIKTSFLHALVPAILQGQVQALSPEVIQALIGTLAKSGAEDAATIEACVVRLDSAMLDLSQIVPLCLKYDLYMALISIFGRALRDWVTPASLLFCAACVAQVEGDESRKKRLVNAYVALLARCLCSDPSTASNYSSSSGHLLVAKAQALGFLLFSTPESIQDAWRAWGCGRGGQGSSSPTATPLLPFLTTPTSRKYPALDFLLLSERADVRQGILNALSAALQGWEALEGEVATLAGASLGLSTERLSQLESSTKTIGQRVVEAAGAFAAGSDSDVAYIREMRESQLRSKHPTSPSVSFNATLKALQQNEVLDFLANLLGSGRVSAPDDLTLRVMQHLVKESGVNHRLLFENIAGACGPSMSANARSQGIELARGAGYLEATARLLHSGGDYEAALLCRLCQDNTDEEQRRRKADGAEVDTPLSSASEYAERVLGDETIAERIRASFLEVIIARSADLVTQNPAAAAGLLLRWLSAAQQRKVLESLASQPTLHFKYLGAVLEEKKSNNNNISYPDQGQGLASTGGVFPDGSQLINTYIALLCRYDPGAVLLYLKSHDGYNVQQCLEVCLGTPACQEAAGYLLERTGQADDALRAYLEALAHAAAMLAKEIKAALESDLPELVQAKLVTRSGSLLRASSMSFPPTPSSFSAVEPRTLLSSRLAELPEAVLERSHLQSLRRADQILQTALDLCTRTSQEEGASRRAAYSDHSGSISDQLWTDLLDFCVDLALGTSISKEGVTEQNLVGSVQPAQLIFAGMMKGIALDDARQTVLSTILLSFARQAIKRAAACVPLGGIASRILGHVAGAPEGSAAAEALQTFLVNLLSDCADEASLLRVARIATGSDAAAVLSIVRAVCSRPCLRVVDMEES